MALGRPVAAGRIPAYTAVIRPEENGFLCDSADEWADALRRLRDPQLRRRFVQNGYDLVNEQFTMSQVGGKWISLLERVSGGKLETCHPDATPSLRIDRQLQIDEWDSFAMQYRDQALRSQAWKWGTKAIRLALRARQFRRALRLLRGIFSPPCIPAAVGMRVLAEGPRGKVRQTRRVESL
jgi:hypothetical protein